MDSTTVIIILEGGLIRDVIGVDDWERIDLDTDGLTDGERRDRWVDAAWTLPEDYPDREEILTHLERGIRLNL